MSETQPYNSLDDKVIEDYIPGDHGSTSSNKESLAKDMYGMIRITMQTFRYALVFLPKSTILIQNLHSFLQGWRVLLSKDYPSI